MLFSNKHAVTHTLVAELVWQTRTGSLGSYAFSDPPTALFLTLGYGTRLRRTGTGDSSAALALANSVSISAIPL